MFDIKLPFWLQGEQLSKLKTGVQTWWDYLYEALFTPTKITDPLSANINIVYLLAWQRDITRFKDEPESLYRKRVKFALENAQDAGSVAGFKRIFERLEIGTVEIIERFDATEWDVIRVGLSNEQLANNHDLIRLIIRKYGRTCRRYTFYTLEHFDLFMRAHAISHELHIRSLEL